MAKSKTTWASQEARQFITPFLKPGHIESANVDGSSFGNLIGKIWWSGLKHSSHSTGQRYRSLFYQLVTDPNNSPRSKTAFWIVIRARRHFWACLFICSTETCVLDPPKSGPPAKKSLFYSCARPGPGDLRLSRKVCLLH